ncbi:MAG: 1-deoxy-D-xylulose-5-phosphate synthase, partial [Proteobacteria bacterium]
NEKLVAITAAMSEGTGIAKFFEQYPDRAFDVGIAEPHAVTFAAGLACRNWKPVVCLYSTFLQRGFDPMIHDVALQNLPVVFAVDRAGLVGADGPTHHGAFDLNYFSMIPRFEIWSPTQKQELEFAFNRAMQATGPFAFRYPRGNCPAHSIAPTLDRISEGYRVYGAPLQKATKVLILVGALGHRMIQALASEPDLALVQLLRVKPVSEELLLEIANLDQTVELKLFIEGALMGNPLFEIFQSKFSGRLEQRGIPDAFVGHGSLHDLERELGWDLASLRGWILG